MSAMSRRWLLALLFCLCAFSLSFHFSVESLGVQHGSTADWHEDDQFTPGRLNIDAEPPDRLPLRDFSHPKAAAHALSPLLPPPIAG